MNAIGVLRRLHGIAKSRPLLELTKYVSRNPIKATYSGLRDGFCDFGR